MKNKLLLIALLMPIGAQAAQQQAPKPKSGMDYCRSRYAIFLTACKKLSKESAAAEAAQTCSYFEGMTDQEIVEKTNNEIKNDVFEHVHHAMSRPWLIKCQKECGDNKFCYQFQQKEKLALEKRTSRWFPADLKEQIPLNKMEEIMEKTKYPKKIHGFFQLVPTREQMEQLQNKAINDENKIE